MKKLTKMCTVVLLVTLVAALLVGCVYYDENGLIGNGQMVTEERALERAVTGMVNHTSFDVVIDPGLEGKSIIEGESNILKLVELNQDSEGMLAIEVKPGTIIIKHKQMTVRIPAVSGGVIRSEGSGNITLGGGKLEGESFDIGISGSGDMRLSLKTKDLDVSINGSGDLIMEAEADTLSANIGGSGDMKIEGIAGRISVSVGGSGNFNGFALAAGDADVRVSGSGDVSVTVSGILTGSVGGSGDVIYDGNPESVMVDQRGSGDVSSR